MNKSKINSEKSDIENHDGFRAETKENKTETRIAYLCLNHTCREKSILLFRNKAVMLLS